MQSGAFLAPEGLGLYILLALISSFFLYFFTMSKAISVSTGPIFTIFLPNGRRRVTLAAGLNGAVY